MNEWDGKKPNPKFPACAQVARRLLAEVYGCKPGDVIPGEDELLARAREVAATEAAYWRDPDPRPGHPGSHGDGKAACALQMVDEIGGL